MKKMVNNLKLILVTVMITISGILMAGTPPDGPPDPQIDAPFDGGVSLLVAAGISYGLKKMHSIKRRKSTEKIL